MIRALAKLTWLEIKIFIREPLGLFGTVGIPVLVFVVMTRMLGTSVTAAPQRPGWPGSSFLPVLTSILIALSAVVSLIAIISIYREGGILKRLRATPLPPIVILTAHVLVKLIFTAITLAAMLLAGRRYFPPGAQVAIVSYGAALLFTTWAILSIGFVIASLVPTARFAQPLATIVVYPMLGVSGLFYPIERMPPALQAIASVSPLTYAVSLLDGIWKGESWFAHRADVAALVLTFVICTAISAKVFRWE
jgi:ABC-2 type transport system permease protein